LEQVTTEKRRAIEELIKKYDQWTEKTPQTGVTRKAARRQAEIERVIRRLGRAKASQIAKIRYPTRKNPPITFYRDLKALEAGGRIEKQWTREEGEFYVVTQEFNQPVHQLLDDLVVYTDFMAEWAHLLQEAGGALTSKSKEPIIDIGNGSFLIDLDVTASIDSVELMAKEVAEMLAKIRNWNQHPLELKPKCSECGGTDFETRDERQYCVKCGLEKKT